jgi:hypothetical protein
MPARESRVSGRSTVISGGAQLRGGGGEVAGSAVGGAAARPRQAIAEKGTSNSWYLL